MIDLIKNTNPDLDIVEQIPTPKTASKWLPDYTTNRNFGSPLLNELADMLKAMCEENGIKVVDVNAAVRGPDGHLPDEYSRDKFVHINNECSAVILDFLREFATDNNGRDKMFRRILYFSVLCFLILPGCTKTTVELPAPDILYSDVAEKQQCFLK